MSSARRVRMPWYEVRAQPYLRVVLAAMLVAACQTMADVKPGEGTKEVFQGHSYDQVWEAASRVADKYFTIKERNRATGTILASERVSVWSYGAWIGIYITPPTSGAGAYTVEVVSRTKLVSDFDEDWQTKVLAELKDVLAGHPISGGR